MIQLRQPPQFMYFPIDSTIVCYEVPAVLDPDTLKIEVYTYPRRFVYTRTTPEAVLGLYEFELLGEET